MHLIRLRSLSVLTLALSRPMSALSTSNPPSFVTSSVEVLSSNPGIKKLDTTWFLQPPATASSFGDSQLLSPCNNFNVPALASPNSPPQIVHSPPSGFAISSFLAAAGVEPTDEVLLYQQAGGMCMYRASYILKQYFGHKGVVSLLQSPLDDLPSTLKTTSTSSSLPLDFAALASSSSAPSSYPVPSSFVEAYPEAASSSPSSLPPLLTYPAMAALVASRLANPSILQDTLILDARGAARFTGEVEETRPGTKSGHIPTSKNLPFTEVSADDKTALKPLAALRAALESKGADLSPSSTQSYVLTCGSGVTACYLAAALSLCGVQDERISVYDGSWAEWGAREGAAVEKGAERV